jgi:hypothetical protein
MLRPYLVLAQTIRLPAAVLERCRCHLCRVRNSRIQTAERGNASDPGRERRGGHAAKLPKECPTVQLP